MHYAKRGFHGLYWIRVACFAEAARAGVPVGNACRKMQGKRDSASLIRRLQKQREMIASRPVRPST